MERSDSAGEAPQGMLRVVRASNGGCVGPLRAICEGIFHLAVEVPVVVRLPLLPESVWRY